MTVQAEGSRHQLMQRGGRTSPMRGRAGQGLHLLVGVEAHAGEEGALDDGVGVEDAHAAHRVGREQEAAVAQQGNRREQAEAQDGDDREEVDVVQGPLRATSHWFAAGPLRPRMHTGACERYDTHQEWSGHWEKQ